MTRTLRILGGICLVAAIAPWTASADVVAPDSAIATSNFFAPAENLITGVGLIDNGGGVETQLHNNIEADGWLSSTTDLFGNPVTAVDQVINFDFETVNHDLTGMYIWQYNGVDGVGVHDSAREVLDFEVFVAPDDVAPLTSVGTFRLGPSSDAGAGAGEPAQFLPFSSEVEDVFRIQFHIRDTYGGMNQDFVGLAEVRFEGAPVPEPSAMVLSLLGLLACVGFRRRK